MAQARELLPKIQKATQDMEDAEADLDRLVNELRVAPRAEKTTITNGLEAAFEKLRSARSTLLELQVLVTEDAKKEG